jgi:acetyl-CoA carboxylase biotin carboxylase subunit
VEKVLIANRGEIAVRVIRACRELGLRSVAVFSDVDREALHARLADERVHIGGAHARDSYLNSDAVLRAARDTGADALHPGYGFLAEQAEFAAACDSAGVTFIGPSADAIAQLGDKSRARELARRAGVPTVPGSEGTVSPEQAKDAADEIGYPIMVKAAAGGGGRGIRIARDADELSRVSADASRDAAAAFGDGSLYLERLIIGARHVEVQVLADTYGNVVHFYERDCSLQRRRQKILEESPSPALDCRTRADMTNCAVSLARSTDYTNAGTAEFLLAPDGSFFFIEMNTRIQVEHPVTEMVTGFDLVKGQLRVAGGEALGIRQEEVESRGSALEFRINAEDPNRAFLPSPGTIESLFLPAGPGVRVDTAAFAGAIVPPLYDSLVAKLIVWDTSRAEAIARGERALEEFRIDGIQTTIPLHRDILSAERFRSATHDVDYLEDYLAALSGGADNG